MTDDDWGKPQVGVASSWNEITPCNLSLHRLALRAKDGIYRAGGFPLQFNTISVSDGISMGHEGMRASLVSREVIADSVETVMHAERLDGFVGLAGCDKSLPGMLMAAARLDLPMVFVYAGPSCWSPQRPVPGHHQRLRGRRCLRGQDDHRGRARRHRAQGLPRRGSVRRHVHRQHDGRHRRGHRRVAPLPARRPHLGRPPADDAVLAGEAVVDLLQAGITPRQIMTKEAFENAIAVTNALGGSTNAVLHLLAIANEAGVGLELEDFNRVAAACPAIADMKPGGKFHMTDLDRVGGVPVVMKHLLDAGLCTATS